MNKKELYNEAIALYKNIKKIDNKYLNATIMCTYLKCEKEDDEIIHIYEEMKRQSIIPTIVAYNCVLTKESKMGNIPRIKEIIEEMKVQY